MRGPNEQVLPSSLESPRSRKREGVNPNPKGPQRTRDPPQYYRLQLTPLPVLHTVSTTPPLLLRPPHLQPRVQVSPMSMMVAVAVWPSPPPQHSPRLGQRASSHTVLSFSSRSLALISAGRKPIRNVCACRDFCVRRKRVACLGPRPRPRPPPKPPTCVLVSTRQFVSLHPLRLPLLGLCAVCSAGVDVDGCTTGAKGRGQAPLRDLWRLK